MPLQHFRERKRLGALIFRRQLIWYPLKFFHELAALTDERFISFRQQSAYLISINRKQVSSDQNFLL